MVRVFVSALLALFALNRAEATHHAAIAKANALPAAIPLPRPRPPGPTIPKIGSTVEGPSSCFLGLVPARALAEMEEPVVGPGLCGAADLVRLKAIRLVNGNFVALHPPAKVRCPLADVLSYWVRGDVAPAVEMAGAHLAGLGIATSYDCRTRNNVIDAKLSEHATGDAIDLFELTLRKGKSLVLTDTSVDKGLRAELMQSACRRFTTVLGPGSDAYHEDHIHLDLLQRHSKYRICQWDVR